MANKIIFPATIVEVEERTSKGMKIPYLLCKLSTGNYFSVTNHFVIHELMATYLKHIGLDVPPTAIATAKKLYTHKVPMRFSYQVCQGNEHIYGHVRLLPIKDSK